MKSKIKGRLECAICGKSSQTANLVSFSKRRIKTVRKPNLHSHKLVIGGETIKIKACTRCKRDLRLAERGKVVTQA